MYCLYHAARRRRDAAVRRCEALKCQIAQKHHLEALREISRRDALLSASGRCLARERVKAVALAKKLVAVTESIRNTDGKRSNSSSGRPLSSKSLTRIANDRPRSAAVISSPMSTFELLHGVGQREHSGAGIQTTVERRQTLGTGVLDETKGQQRLQQQRRLRKQQRRRQLSPSREEEGGRS